MFLSPEIDLIESPSECDMDRHRISSDPIPDQVVDAQSEARSAIAGATAKKNAVPMTTRAANSAPAINNSRSIPARRVRPVSR